MYTWRAAPPPMLTCGRFPTEDIMCVIIIITTTIITTTTTIIIIVVIIIVMSIVVMGTPASSRLAQTRGYYQGGKLLLL